MAVAGGPALERGLPMTTTAPASPPGVKLSCSICPECETPLEKTFWTDTGHVFCCGWCRDRFYRREHVNPQLRRRLPPPT